MKVAVRSLVLFLALLTLAVGSADARSKKMLESAEQSPQPAAGKALVVFLRSSFVGSAIQSSIYQVEGDFQEFLGIVSNKTRIATEVEPGQHRFMVIAENADFLEAEVEAGKTYYVLISPRPGAWKARFSLLPIRNDAAAKYNLHSADFKKWMKKTTRVEIGPDAQAWFEENQASITDKRVKYLQKWNDKSKEELAELTLNANDGV
ncbi:hypothetical protein [Pseudomarimonas arenosa]|uniref:DUF2846 domain-containing protein n=1 Tax=Pseudomarimonas arenosa TaxID=2774145 RepID=A0AAW3ZP88_9GAMM|nr:hypothetical protein [Pseudomarimonas arenosa]MBD8526735.1 hypothetical protein [Pseudomarimonas arenosa]